MVATPLEFLVENAIPEETTTAIGGLAGHGKTWIALSIAKALVLAPCKLWDVFEVKKKVPVLYLIPEVGDKSLLYRLKKMRMEKFPKQDFMTRTFSQGETLSLNSKEVIAAARDRVVFLDTTICFVKGDENVASDNLHPNGRYYETLQDLPLAEITKEHLEWLKSLWQGKATVASKAKLNPLRPGIDIAERLTTAGLKYTTHKEGDKVYFNYHSLMGKCLVRGASHAQKGERPNERQSSFVYDTKTNEVYHFCFSAGCSETPQKTRVALAGIGLSLDDLTVEWWDACFRSASELAFTSQPELAMQKFKKYLYISR